LNEKKEITKGVWVVNFKLPSHRPPRMLRVLIFHTNVTDLFQLQLSFVNKNISNDNC